MAHAEILHALIFVEMVNCLHALRGAGYYDACICRSPMCMELKCDGRKVTLRRPSSERVTIRFEGASSERTATIVADRLPPDHMPATARRYAKDIVAYLAD